MENYVLWIVIAAYLLMVLFKNKKNSTAKKTQAAATLKEYDAAVITATLAAAMGSEKGFVVKSVYLVGNPDKYRSSWKIAGRTETMMRKKFLKNK